MKKYLFAIFIISLILLFSAFTNSKEEVITKEVIGKKLFFDNMLSSDQSIHCGSCHIPQFAFADTVAFSKGVNGKLTSRNTPSVMNMSSREIYFFDGRAATLESQVVFPIENPNEMNLPFSEAVKRISCTTTYKNLFKKVYKKVPDSASIVDAIAAYERTLETGNSQSDRWINDLPNTMTSSQKRGHELFVSEKTKCFDCHFTPDFTSDEFKNIGLFNGKELNDSGRFSITKNKVDVGKFKIPGLRNVAITAPYMHNGQFKTLREVIDFYDNPSKVVSNSINRDTILPAKIGLTEQEKIDLVAYLNALTDERFIKKNKK